MNCGSAENFVNEMGGNAYYAGLAEGFVDIAPLNESIVAPGTQDAIDQVKALMESGEWDVFSGVKLNITVADGKVTVEKVDAPLMSNGLELKDGAKVPMENSEIVPAGGASIDDGVIKGSMNYNVAGVEEH